MKAKIKIISYVTLFVLSTLESGCASLFNNSRESINFQSTTIVDKFTPREKTEFTHRTPDELERSNYVNLGELNISYTVMECDSDKKNSCRSIIFEDTPSKRILVEAAKYGADLVQLIKDNTQEESHGSRRGGCQKSRISERYEYVWSNAAGTTVNRLVPYTECIYWNYESYPITLLRSSGNIWRHDPAYVQQNKLWQVLESGNSTQVKKFFTNKSQLEQILLDGKSYPLYVILKYDNVDALKVMLDLGMDVNTEVPYEFNTTNKKANYLLPLMAASNVHAKKSEKLLLNRGAKNIDRAKEYQSPIIDNTKDNQSPLIVHGILETDQFGRGPLWQAAFTGDYELAKSLLKQGANVNATDQNGETPLIRAAASGNAQIVELFLKSGAILNMKDKGGRTALENALFILKIDNSGERIRKRNLEVVIDILREYERKSTATNGSKK